MKKLAEIRKRYKLPVQSHLSENPGEVSWVQELCPESRFYGDAYRRFDLFGGKDCPAIMAHCVYCPDEEIQLIKEQGVYVAHCPQSNTNLSSGIAPVKLYLEQGIHTGLGTDIAGGHSLSMLRAVADSIQVSKLHWRYIDSNKKHFIWGQWAEENSSAKPEVFLRVTNLMPLSLTMRISRIRSL